MFRTRLRNSRLFADRGFTLVELLITLAVIAVLGGVAAVGISSVFNNTKDSEATQHLRAIVAAESRSNVDAGVYSGLGTLTSTYNLSADAAVGSAVILGTQNECFIATITSSTGAKFFATDVMADPKNEADSGVTSAMYTTCSVTPVAAAVPAPVNDQPAPNITTLTLPAGKAQNAYSVTIQTDPTKDTASSGSKLFSVSSGALPAGLTLDSATGVVSGMPTVAGVFGFTIRVDNANGFDTQAYSLTIDTQVTPFTNVSAVRSTSTGAVYSGAHEGVTVSFQGGACTTGSTALTITYQATSPTGLSPVSASFTWNPANTTTTVGTFNLSGIQNGTAGNVKLSVTCYTGQTPYQQSFSYTQAVPATTVTVTSPTSPNVQVVAWTAVSSLPTTFTGTWVLSPTGNPNPSGTIAATSALTTTVSFPAGNTYNYTVAYTITPSVSGGSSGPSSGNSIYSAFPAPPTATSVVYASTGSGATIMDGTWSWGQSAACPTGTTFWADDITNYRWNSSTGVQETGVFTDGGWVASKLTNAWAPAYAVQGSPYRETVYTKCQSPNTGQASVTASALSTIEYTPMATPSAPSWNGFDFQNFTRGDTNGFGTCWNSGYWCAGSAYAAEWPYWSVYVRDYPSYGQGNVSYQMDYNYSCPTGSVLNTSYYRTDNLTYGGGNDLGYFGKQDGWTQNQAGDEMDIQHSNPNYSCKTLWRSSPVSPNGGTIVERILKRW